MFASSIMAKAGQSIIFISLLFSASGIHSAHAAEAEVTNFNVKNEYINTYGIPIFLQKVTYAYRLLWSGGTDRRGDRAIDWNSNNMFVSFVSFVTHFTPVTTSGTDNIAPNSEGEGNFYRIKVRVTNSANFNTVYASDEKTDNVFSN